jgi:hypothetical protein
MAPSYEFSLRALFGWILPTLGDTKVSNKTRRH